jgi:hypothetical protein
MSHVNFMHFQQQNNTVIPDVHTVYVCCHWYTILGDE